MHAVTNTQSKKGNGLGMANVMYDKRFFILFLYFTSRNKLSYYFTLPIWTALVSAFLKD